MAKTRKKFQHDRERIEDQRAARIAKREKLNRSRQAEQRFMDRDTLGMAIR